MGQVLGIGGVFYKAADGAAVKDWWTRVLGIEVTPWGAAMFKNPDQGFQQLTTFAADSGYFAPSDAPFMINLIVDDMDAVLAKVEAAGETVLNREDHEYGRFAWVMDPAGIKIELWQPLGDSPA